jgi:hypothetical protein
LCEVLLFISGKVMTAMLDDVCEEDDVLQPFDEMTRWTDSLALGCIIELNRKTTLPRVKIKGFLKKRKNTDFWLEGVDYGLSPYISGVWEVKQCLTSSARSY